MKRSIIGLASVLVVFVAVFAVLVLRPVPKVKAGMGCSNASLHGNYGLVLKGTYIQEVGGTGIYLSPTWDIEMLAHFDGGGVLSGTWVGGAYWGVLYDPSSFSDGSYKVNPDCTVSITIPPVEHVIDDVTKLNGVLTTRDGDEVKGTAYNPTPLTGTFRAKKVHEW